MKKIIILSLAIFSFVALVPEANALATRKGMINEATKQCASATEYTYTAFFYPKYPKGWKAYDERKQGMEFEAYCRAYGYETISGLEPKLGWPTPLLIIMVLFAVSPFILILFVIFKKKKVAPNPSQNAKPNG